MRTARIRYTVSFFQNGNWQDAKGYGPDYGMAWSAADEWEQQGDGYKARINSKVIEGGR